MIAQVLEFSQIEKEVKEKKQDIIKRLEAEKAYIPTLFNGLEVQEDDRYIDVRLNIQMAGPYIDRIKLLFGDSQYDLDHRGYWASGMIGLDTNCQEAADDLIREVLDAIAWDYN